MLAASGRLLLWPRLGMAQHLGQAPLQAGIGAAINQAINEAISASINDSLHDSTCTAIHSAVERDPHVV